MFDPSVCTVLVCPSVFHMFYSDSSHEVVQQDIKDSSEGLIKMAAIAVLFLLLYWPGKY